MTVHVKLREQPTDGKVASMGNEAPEKSDRLGRLGLAVDNLSESVAHRLGLEDASGVVITSVRPGSPAELAGLAPSMVIAQVDRRPIRTVEDLHAALDKGDIEGGVLLLVRDQHGSRFIVIQPEK